MRFLQWIIFIALLTPALSISGNVSAQVAWKDLENEPSRNELFQLIIAADKQGKELPQVALPKPFQFPEHTTFDFEANKPRLNVVFGIDISHHNGSEIAFELLAEQNVKFIYCKATQGVGFKDKRFAHFWSTIDALPSDKRVLRGAYHFLSAGTDGEAQADSYLEFLKANGGLRPTDMPPVVDLEWDVAKVGDSDRWADKTPEQIMTALLSWLKKVEKSTGRTPVIYTARSWWRERMGGDAQFAKLSPYKIWVADYSQSSRGTEDPRVPGNARWHLWQFTDSAQVKTGYGRKLDANIFKGTADDFERQFGAKLFR